jgi:hypothetical protein
MGDIKDFKFPSGFGFTGSAGRTTIREHSRGPRRFAEGGIVKATTGKAVVGSQVTPAEADKLKKAGARDTVPAPKVGSTMDTLKNQTERRMKDLGLKKGGPVKKAMGGPVGYKKGGKKR